MAESATSRPLRSDAERNRQRILRAAAEVFTTQGLGASLDDVARRAGVGVGTVYRRFADKETLVAELFTDRIDSMVARAERAYADPDPWSALVGFLEYVTDMFSGDLGLRQMLMFGTYGADRVSYARDQMRPAVTRLIERAQATGQLRQDLAPTDIPFIGFMLSTAAQYAGEMRPGIWRRYLTLLIDGLRAARTGTTPLPVAPLNVAEMERLMRTQEGRGASGNARELRHHK
jgi:AcrR family transcriptional regulator